MPVVRPDVRMAIGLVLAVMTAPSVFWIQTAGAQSAAKQLFGRTGKPADLAARAIGSYARGCLAGGTALPVDGPNWQAMRLSRNRNWGHPALVRYLERLAREAAGAGDWPGLLVGDMAQPRGGPMLTGHRSHQIGLDADIWLNPMPDRTLSYNERETTSAVSVLKTGTRTINPAVWTNKHARILKRAASYPDVARIFVHPAIKKQLCDWPGAGRDRERAWLRRIRPWYGHHYHFHVRLTCPAGYAGCRNQDPPPPGDGCGKELDWWLGSEPWTPKKPTGKPSKPRRELRLTDLPAACTTVIKAPAPDGTVNRVSAAQTVPDIVPLPNPRPAFQ